ncbi:MAG: LmbZ [Flavobacteriaceae bacterium]|nr:LmbZ [Flavobacteriaceae bacterium]
MNSIAIIGCGLIGKKRGLSALELNKDIKYVYDLKKDSAKNLAKELSAIPVNQIKEIFDDNSIDLVVISTSHNVLHEIAEMAIKSNKNVLIEKPSGINLSEVLNLREISKASKSKIKIGFNYRFHPAILKSKELIQLGMIGDVTHIRARHGHGARYGYESEWRCNKELSGGGELLDQGSHIIDLCNMFIKGLNLKYSSTQNYFWNVSVEDNCFLALENDEKQMSWIHVSWTEWKNLFSFEIFGKYGKISIEGLGGSYGVETLKFYKMSSEMGPPYTKIYEYPQKDKSWIEELKEFELSINENRDASGNLDDAINVWKIIDKVYSI